MRKSLIIILIGLGMLIFMSPASHALIMVDFNPNPVEVVEGNTFSLDILADIPEDDAVVGWGLGLEITNEEYLDLENITIGKQWGPVIGSDFFGGLGLAPVWGPDVLLATLDFTCLGIGTSFLELTADIQAEPFLRGFVGPGSIPVAPGSAILAQFNQGIVNQVPVPEPATLLLLGTGVVSLAGYARRKKAMRL